MAGIFTLDSFLSKDCFEQNLAFLVHSGVVGVSGLLSAHHCCSRHIIAIVDIESMLAYRKWLTSSTFWTRFSKESFSFFSDAHTHYRLTGIFSDRGIPPGNVLADTSILFQSEGQISQPYRYVPIKFRELSLPMHHCGCDLDQIQLDFVLNKV